MRFPRTGKIGNLGRRLALKLYRAFLRDRSLLDGDHLPLELRQLGRRLPIAANKERCRPKNHDRGGRSQTVVATFLILRSRDDARARGDRRRNLRRHQYG